MLITAAAFVLYACGASDVADIYESPPRPPLAASRPLPATVPAVPAFVLSKRQAFTSSEITRLKQVTGVAAVARLTIRRLEAEDATGTVDAFDVATVEPLSFRNVVPAPTRDADFVWTSLADGDAVMTAEASERINLGREPSIRFAGGPVIEVGAFADNGHPNLADVLLVEAPLKLGSRIRHVVVVGAESGVALSALREKIERRSDARLQRLLPKIQLAAHADKAGAAPAVPAAAIQPVPVAAGLHSVLTESIKRLVTASANQVWVVSGYRTTQHQHELWVGALQRYGTPEAARQWVAPPGHSAHERGLAVDLGGDLALATRLIEELRLPLWRPMAWEPWHFELVGSRG